MASIDWKPSRYRDNFSKYFSFVGETGQRVLLQILRWLHEGSIEDFILGIPRNQFNAIEKTTVVNLKNGDIQLEDTDISFLYKITQMVDCLESKNDDVWCRRCSPEKKDEVEHLLFLLKDIRNNLAHSSKTEKNLTDLDVKNKSEEIKHLLINILEKAGQKANVDPSEIKEMIDFVETDILRIYRDENTDSSIGPRLKNIILNDLKPLDDDNSFLSELEGYSLPYFQIEEDPQTSYRLNKILTINDDVTVIIVTGEAGEGKSAMSRFLSNSWMEGKVNAVDNLASFDIVIRVECKRIYSSDVSQFLEDLLPSSAFFFQKTSSFKRQLIPFTVLWIMDGYDEKASGCDGFLKAILQEISDKHKIIITTRPNTLNDVQRLLLFKTEIKTKTLLLERLREENIDEIINNLIVNEKDRVLFKSNFNAIAHEGKSLLKTPLNMTLYIKLWLDDPSMAHGFYTADILFTKATNDQLARLFTRLKHQTDLSDDDLIMHIDIWFYNYLCRETFHLALQDMHAMPVKTVNDLKKKASMLGLTPSKCLSSFLVKDNLRDDFDFQHSIQIHTLSSLYMKKMEEYSIDDVKLKTTDFRDISTHVTVSELLKFYTRVINADDMLTQNAEHYLFPVKKIISFFEPEDQYGLLFNVATACDFNPIFKNFFAQTISELIELARGENDANLELLLNSFVDQFNFSND